MATRTVSNSGGNYNSVGTWVEGAVPTSADDVVFTATSGNLTVNTTADAKSINFTNYVNTLTFNTNVILNLYGNLTLVPGFTQVGTAGVLRLNTTCSITSNGVAWNCILRAQVAITITLNDNLTVRSYEEGASLSVVMNGNNLYVNANLAIGAANGAATSSGTTNFHLIGTGTWSQGSQHLLNHNLTINASGTISTVAATTYRFGGGSITYVAGTLSMNSTSTLIFLNNPTIDISVTLTNVNISTTTLTLTSNLTWSGLLTISNGGITKGGSGLFVPSSTSSNLTILIAGTFDTGIFQSTVSINNFIVGQTGSNIVLNGVTFNVNGNLSINSGNGFTVSGTSQINLVGTGIWSHAGSATLRCNLNINTSGTITISSGQSILYNIGTLTYISGTVITNGTTLDMSSTSGVTLNTYGMTWNNVRFGAVQTATLNSDVDFSGTLTISSVVTFSGVGKLIPTSTASINISPTVTYDNNLFPSTIQVVNLTLGANGPITTINNLTIYVSGNFTPANGSNGEAAGSSTVIMNGTGTINMANNGRVSMGVVIDTSGTITITNQPQFRNSLTYVSGIVITAGSTLTHNSTVSVTYDTNGIIWNNITFATTITVINNSLLTAIGTVTYNAASTVSWLGTHGFNINSLVMLTSTATQYTFTSGLTYTINSSIQAISTSPSAKPTLKSSANGVQSNIDLKYGATCALGYVNFTDINSVGRPIRTFKGVLSNTNNIVSITDLPTITD